MENKAKKILIAEDERPIAHALELKLNSAGFSTKVVYNGEEALNEIEKNKYNLLMLDLIMPKKDGFAVLSEMKEKNTKIPVVVLSNLGQEEDKIKVTEMGAKGYFVKSDVLISGVVEFVKKILK